jgi:hypothetical protein
MVTVAKGSARAGVSGYDFRWGTLAPLRLPDGVVSTAGLLLRHYRTPPAPRAAQAQTAIRVVR